MRSTILLSLLLGGSAGLALAAFSLRTPRPDAAARAQDFPDPGEMNPTPVVPPLPPTAGARQPASPLTSRVALGGFLRKVVWEPDRGEPIRDATVRVVLAAPTGTEEELGRCVTDERGAFAFETDLSYRRLPAALRLKPEKEGWTDAWPVAGLPVAVVSLPHSRADLVWHMTRADSVGPRVEAAPVEEGAGDGFTVYCRRRGASSSDSHLAGDVRVPVTRGEGRLDPPPKPR